jgi:hypothetical protein
LKALFHHAGMTVPGMGFALSDRNVLQQCRDIRK